MQNSLLMSPETFRQVVKPAERSFCRHLEIYRISGIRARLKIDVNAILFIDSTYSVNYVVYLIRTKNKIQNHSFYDLYLNKMPKLVLHTMLFTLKTGL